MKKLATFLILFISLLVLATPGSSFFWDKYVIKINNKKYDENDIKKWWKFWKEPKMKFPKSPDPFIEWILFSEEALMMGLDKEKSYQKKLKTFLEVRSLMQLRYDEIDSKIDLSRRNLWQLYVKEYTPRIKIKALITTDKMEAQNWINNIKGIEDFKKIFIKQEKEGKAKDFGWERPRTIPKDLKKILLSSKAGKILGPLQYHKRFYIIWIEEKLGPDLEDFKSLKEIIAYRYKKIKARELTQKLIKKLRKKYKVTIYQDLINKITLEELPPEIKNEIVLRIENQKMTAEQFQSNLKKEIKYRFKKENITEEKLLKIKTRLINDIIAQTLTSWEALNRHYERNVLRDIYEFYKRNRLVREFEEKIIWPQIKITEKEIKNYYEEHKKDFIKPERVEIAVIKTQDKQLALNIHQRLMKGEDFFEIAREIQFHGAHPERHEINNIVPEMREIIKEMSPGEISQIIRVKEWYCIVKLIRKYPEQVHPFDLVKESIKKSLAQEKFEILKKEYLEELKKKSKIEINKKEWERLYRELGGKNVV